MPFELKDARLYVQKVFGYVCVCFLSAQGSKFQTPKNLPVVVTSIDLLQQESGQFFY